MSAPKEVGVGSTAYFWFAANTPAGAAGDGATPLYDVRLAGAASGAAPTASGTPTLLTHASYSDGLHEIAIDTTGYAEGSEYAVFCTLTISSVNPAGWVGSFIVRAAASTLYELVQAILVDTGTTLDGNITAIKATTDNLPSAVKKNTARRLHFYMVLASDHVTPATGLTVAATRALDAGAFGAAAGAVTEVSAGWYYIDAAAGDLNGDTVAWKMTAATADPCCFSA